MHDNPLVREHEQWGLRLTTNAESNRVALVLKDWQEITRYGVRPSVIEVGGIAVPNL